MATSTEVPVAERILALLRELGIQRTHVAGSLPEDWRALAASSAERIASLSLVCPTAMDANAAAAVASRLLVFHGDRGAAAERIRAQVAGIPGATFLPLREYPGLPFADVAAERGDELGPALLDSLERAERQSPAGPAPASTPEAGEISGLSYRMQGGGPPLLLLPLALAPSQWEPLLPQLGRRFRTIVLGGPHLGFVPLLESRGQTPGYLRVVRNVLEEVAPRPGDAILDVGCGTGVVDRWLAQHTRRAHAITAVDRNRYLLREAETFARKAGLEQVVRLQEANAEALPFPASQFDVSLSFTVMDEGDAGRMLAELVRVTRPGGRVAAIVRAADAPALCTLPLRAELQAKAAQAMSAGPSLAGGCADAGLYRLFHAAGLTDVRKFPQLVVYDSGSVVAQLYKSRILGALAPDEAAEWQAAAVEADAQGGFVLAVPHHCAIGTRL
jgi:SAM-dependent methyltransferase